MNIYDILKDSAYKTEQFADEAIAKLNEKIVVKEDKNGKQYAVDECLVRKKDIKLNPMVENHLQLNSSIMLV